ncbi:hypothetical protein EOA32_07290 [Mesorhizobium sp. M1A.F.Ca.ET.072.01.1.1]|uniref:hypothetical protein n=1 Tax=Mesorhizobium sp. M1A.F.Ca.ET.072.01.1.1 TaxID=2496753 RepID=UPI000FD199C5|nr:hypothetical protein [Mesorhizobium sp. M1A.F.Ca.ET.072.01.1.1]RUW53983.1 hypothetical protein EOA32_07290 [Mesorhizobium sp. M1A.F.Ca.ET.072.01.1.1]TIV04275.1 MAG: hypothetical protein E5W04_04360 [Mesorhizobium sp.]
MDIRLIDFGRGGKARLDPNATPLLFAFGQIAARASRKPARLMRRVTSLPLSGRAAIFLLSNGLQN